MLTLYYERVSTKEQADSGLGLVAQHARNFAVARMIGREGIENRYMDEGVSGAVPFADRREGRMLMDRVGAVDKVRRDHDWVVITYSLDRLSRDVDDGRAMLRWFDERGVKVYLSNEGGNAIDVSSAMGRCLVTMRLAMGELERGLTGERTKAALGALQARGGKVGEPPYGWRKTEVRAKFEPHPEEQKVIALILELDVAGISARMIAIHLNGAHGSCWKTRDGKEWSHVQIGRIIERMKPEEENGS